MMQVCFATAAAPTALFSNRVLHLQTNRDVKVTRARLRKAAVPWTPSLIKQFRPTSPRMRPPCICMSQSDSPSSKNERRTVSGAAIALVLAAVITAIPTLCAIVVSLPFLLIERRKRTIQGMLMRQWLRLTLFISGIQVKITGADQIQPGTLVIANRQSPLDVLALATLPSAPRFMLPARALSVPVVGWILRLAGCIPINGTDRKSAGAALELATESLRAGTSVTLFPEGKPGENGSLGRFLTPVFKVARTGVPVVPVSVSGGWHICSGGVVPVRWGCLSMVVHPPLARADSDKELAVAAHAAVNKGLPSEFRS